MPGHLSTIAECLVYLDLPDPAGESLRGKALNFLTHTKKKKSHEFAYLSDQVITEFAREFVRGGVGKKYWSPGFLRKWRYPRDEKAILKGVTDMMLVQRKNKKKKVLESGRHDEGSKHDSHSSADESESNEEDEEDSEESADSDFEYMQTTASSPATVRRAPGLGPSSQELVDEQLQTGNSQGRTPRRSQRSQNSLPSPALTGPTAQDEPEVLDSITVSHITRSQGGNLNKPNTTARSDKKERRLRKIERRANGRFAHTNNPDSEGVPGTEQPVTIPSRPLRTSLPILPPTNPIPVQEPGSATEKPFRRYTIYEQRFNGQRSDTNEMPELQAKIVRHLQKIQDKYLRMSHAEDLTVEKRRESSVLARSYQRTIPEVEILFRASAAGATIEEMDLAREVQEAYY